MVAILRSWCCVTATAVCDAVLPVSATGVRAAPVVRHVCDGPRLFLRDNGDFGLGVWEHLLIWRGLYIFSAGWMVFWDRRDGGEVLRVAREVLCTCGGLGRGLLAWQVVVCLQRQLQAARHRRGLEQQPMELGTKRTH